MRTKRVEYEGTLYDIKDGNLDREIGKKVRNLVEDIFNGVGKEYIIPDLELLINQQLRISISDFCLDEAYDIMCKTKGDEENEI